MANKAGLWHRLLRLLELVHLGVWIGGGVVSSLGVIWGVLQKDSDWVVGAGLGFVFCLMMLLIALFFRNKKQPAEQESPPIYKSPLIEPPSTTYEQRKNGTIGLYVATWEDDLYREGNQQLRTLREKRELKPLSDFQDGLSVRAIDPSTYATLRHGQVSSDPASIHLERDSGHLKNFDVHYLPNKRLEIVGFASLQDAHAVRSAVESRIQIFSRKASFAPELVTLDVTRIIACESHMIRNDTFRFDIRVKPAS